MPLLQNDFYIGSPSAPLYHYSNRSLTINGTSGTFSVDPIGNELTVDTFTFTVKYRYDADLVYAPRGASGYRDTNGKIYRLSATGVRQYWNFVPRNSDKLIDSNGNTFRIFAGYEPNNYLDVPYGVPCYWYINNAYYAKGYLKTVDRVGKYSWKVTCISGIGLLDERNHGGGIYTGQTFREVAQSIIGNTFRFVLDPAVANVSIYGHLPYDTARNNLHRLLFSCGASMLKSTATVDYKIAYLNASETTVPASRIAMGGSVKYTLPANTVEITEHAFYQTAHDETVVVFDNTTEPAADNLTVVFDQAPVYDLQTSGTLTIIESGVNYAIVSGIGIITAKKYTHTQQIVRQSVRSQNEVERLKSVTGNELISSANSLSVARRVLAYYNSAKTVKAKIHLNNEKLGSMLSTVDAFYESTTAIFGKATVKPSTFLGADVELIDGYTPGNNGNTYNTRQLIPTSGTFTVPSGVTLLKIAAIGGGQGGQGGFNGSRGNGTSSQVQQVTGGGTRRWEYKTSQVAASGGQGGSAGDPGKVYVAEVTVTPGQVLTVTVGQGGTGGSANGGWGADGTPSTVTGTGVDISSDNGLVTAGYFDVIGQTYYASPGEAGQRGGDGGLADGGGSGNNGADGLPGESIGTASGGAGGIGAIAQQPEGESVFIYDRFRGSGGGGGGAAVGANGSDGTNGFASISEVDGGNGGNGATATAPSQPTYGNGGTGGNGGGGGGNAGLVQWQFALDMPNPRYTLGIPGNGGSGSAGASGGDGCVIIYY